MNTRAMVIAMWLGAAASAAAETPKERDEKELERLTQQLLDAVAPGDWSVWERHLDENAVYAAEDGRVMDKKQLEAEFKPLPPGYSGTITAQSFVIRLHGDVAVVSYEGQEDEKIHGQTVRPLYHTTDTWRKKGGRWRLIASQVVALPTDPPAVTLPREALAPLAGKYQLADGVTMTVSLDGDKLVAEREGRPRQVLLAETETVFFVPGAPRGRKLFVRDRAGKVTHVLDRREGHDLRWTRVD